MVLESEVSLAATCDKRQSLEAFFAPRSVAVIGATDKAGQVGRAIMWNLISSPFGGTVYPVNPDRKSVLGIRTYAAIDLVPDPVDLAVIASPAASVPEIIHQCARHRVRGAIILSSGFRETGELGLEIERRVLSAARAGHIRLLGPNCLGVMRPAAGFNATFAPSMARAGSVALVSQSAGICTSLLDWGLQHQLGFSTVMSIGSMLDLGWPEIIDYLGNDPKTRSIVIYMESLGDARAFLSAAREVALDKPILLMKGGRTETGAGVAARHAGGLNGSDQVFDAALRRVGVLRVQELSDIFHITEALACQPRPAGPRLAVVTNAAGPGVLAADVLAGLGDELAKLTPETLRALHHDLETTGVFDNPIDLVETAGAHEYEAAVDLAARDPHVDGVLVIQSPQSTSDRVETANRLTQFAHSTRKPILAAWMGSPKESEGVSLLNKAGIPTFAFPETAVRAFHYMWRYTRNLRALYETPSLPEENRLGTQMVTDLAESARRSGRTSLNRSECQQLLAVCGVPMLDDGDATGAHELTLGARVDPEFGPVLFFGLGRPFGTAVSNAVFALPPLNTTLARHFLDQSEAFKMLNGVPDPEAFDMPGLEALMVRFSQLVLEHPLFSAIDIYLRSSRTKGIAAFGARIEMHGQDVHMLPRPAIRPYPSQYIFSMTLKDGTELKIRPIRPEDEPLLVRFHRALSDESVYLRYFAPISLESRIRHERLTRMCFIDYDRQVAFVGEVAAKDSKASEIIAVGRIVKSASGRDAELATIVADAYQHRGVGLAIAKRLVDFARDEGLDQLTACVLAENLTMRGLLEKVGFRFPNDNSSATLDGMLPLKVG